MIFSKNNSFFSEFSIKDEIFYKMNSITLTALSHIDPTFYEIICYQNGERPNFEMHDIFVLMTTFRRNLSFQWIESIREDIHMASVLDIYMQ